MKPLKIDLMFSFLFIAFSAFVITVGYSHAQTTFTDREKIQIQPEKKAVYLLTQLQAKAYPTVADFFSSLLQEKPMSKEGTRVLDEVYKIMSTRDEKAIWDNWCASKDVTHAAFVIRGKWLIDQAWKTRGSGYANTVTEERKRLMDDYLRQAQQDLEQAYRMEPDDPASAAAMITVCVLRGLPEQVMEKWFQRAVTADAVSLSAYSAKLYYLAPIWYGTQLKMKEFAEYCFRKSPPGSTVYSIMLKYIDYNAKYTTSSVIARGQYLLQPDVQELINTCLQQLEEDFPGSFKAKMIRATFASYLGNSSEALSIFNSVLTKNPDNVDVLVERAKYYSKRAQFHKAEDDLQHILKTEPDNAQAMFLLAQLNYEYHHDYDQAVTYLNEAIKLRPRQKQYYYTRAMFHSKKGIYDKAIDDLTSVIALDNQEEQAYMERARCYSKSDQEDKAIDDFLRVQRMKGRYAMEAGTELEQLASSPQSNQVSTVQDTQPDPMQPYLNPQQTQPRILTLDDLMRQAEENYYRRKAKEAEATLQKIISLDQQYAPAYFLLGQVTEKLSYDYKKALTFYDKAAALDNKNQKYLLQLGKIKYLLRQYNEAIADFSALITLSPQDGHAFYQRALCFDALQETEKAIADMQHAAMFSPDIPEAEQYVQEHMQPEEEVIINQEQELLMLAEDNIRLRRYGAAEKGLYKILKLSPSDDYAYFKLGIIAIYRDNDHKTAISFFNKAIALNDQYGDYYLNRGFSHQFLNQHNKAVADFNQLLELKPTYATGFISRAESYEKLKKYQKAEADYLAALKYSKASKDSINRHLARLATKTKRTIEETPENIDLLLERVKSYLADNEIDAAVNELQSIIAIEPENDAPYYLLGKIYSEKQSNPDKALQYYTKAIELHAGNRDYFFNRGRIYYQQQNFSMAEQDFSAAIVLEPNTGQTYYYRGVCNQELGRRDQAVDDFLKAKQFDPSWTSAVNGHLKEMNQ